MSGFGVGGGCPGSASLLEFSEKGIYTAYTHGWRVDLRLDIRDEVDRLLVRAERSSERGDLEGAREFLQQAFALGDNRIEILGCIEDVERRMLPVAEQRRRERQAMDEVQGKIRKERASRRW